MARLQLDSLAAGHAIGPMFSGYVHAVISSVMADNGPDAREAEGVKYTFSGNV